MIQIQAPVEYKTPDFKVIDNPAIMDAIKDHLTCVGTVFRNPDGYVYLKIDDQFITRLFPLIQDEKLQMPDYFSEPKKSGAHISIIFPEEYSGPIQTEDVGKSITFSVSGLFEAKIFGKTYVAIEIVSPQLEVFRSNYDLKRDRINFKGFLVPFHITIAVGKSG